MSFSLT